MNSFFEKFSSIEQTLVQEKGPFKLFALLERATAFDDWDVIMASKGLPDNDMSVLKEVIEKIHAVLTREEKMKMNAVILLDVNDHFVKEVQNFLAEHDNPTEFSNAEINGLEISRGYIITSPIPQTEQVSSLSKTLLTQASKWIRKAATQGDSDAQNTLGLMYLKGEGVKKNLNIAKKWFKKAATLGHAQARQNLRALSH
ncbi:tetratricopeptide repeat protein [Candidatus Marithioploca araucensis]|uniref:Tetratricopeptide repeat protein n=1 Tax=Candidatus Marithioploca araucensis TaxID=70273 RepID=A0ABT7VTD3_9GAMM|nr:tetratricopeptide repeat protein [Candidatus Marithioploca araucensis]